MFTWTPAPSCGHPWLTRLRLAEGTFGTPGLASRPPTYTGPADRCSLGSPQVSPLQSLRCQPRPGPAGSVAKAAVGTLVSSCALCEPGVGERGRHPGASVSARRCSGNFAGGGTRSAARQGRRRSARSWPDAWSRRCRGARGRLPPSRLRTAGRCSPGRPAGSGTRRPGKRDRKVCAEESLEGGPPRRRPGSAERRGPGWQQAHPSLPPLPSSAPPKFGSPAIFLAPLPCEA